MGQLHILFSLSFSSLIIYLREFSKSAHINVYKTTKYFPHQFVTKLPNYHYFLEAFSMDAGERKEGDLNSPELNITCYYCQSLKVIKMIS